MLRCSSLAARILAVAALSALACRRDDVAAHGHDHGGHDHGSGTDAHAHGEHDEGPPSMALTLYSDTHELFVELGVPAAGLEHAFHAHVTRLADNQPAVDGTFKAIYRDLSSGTARDVTTIVANGVARAGIFTPSGQAPLEPGTYRLQFEYAAGDEATAWDGGDVVVGVDPVPPPEPPAGEITFLKETAWKIPFRVELPARMRMARPVRVPGRVEADPARTVALAAPAAGTVQWSSGGTAVLQGMRVRKGDVLGTLAAASAASSWSERELARQRAEIDAEAARADVERVGDLVDDGLLPERRLREARAELARAEAARAHVRREQGGGGAGPVLHAPADGVLVQLATGGEQASAGDLLALVAPDDRVLVRGRLRGHAGEPLAGVEAARLRVAGSSAWVSLSDMDGRLVGQAQALDATTLATDVAFSVANDGRLRIGMPIELSLGVGPAEEQLTVPAGAVVEINTRPFAFVAVSGESFDRRPLQLGPSDGVRVAVLSGLTESDRVVTVGGFDVHVASLSGTVESHRH